MDVEEVKVVEKELKGKSFLDRYKRTGGQLRGLITEERYRKFTGDQENAWNGSKSTEVILIGTLEVSSKLFAVEASCADKNTLYSERWVVVPQSEWVKMKVYEVYAGKKFKVFTGLDGDWENKYYKFPSHETIKTYANGVKHQIDRCREQIKGTDEGQNSELIICPANYPAIDGATNRRTLYQTTINIKREITPAYIK